MIPKFRAWEHDVKFMYDQVRITQNFLGIGETIIEVSDGMGWERVDEKYLMQSTGLVDVNQEEVFKDDIVWHDQNEEYGVVEFDEAKFVIRWQNGYVEDLFERIDLLKVVGNVHAHGHLLESGGDRE
ncbi:hypothetical protein KFV05_07935 [Macrococcoides canis]|uniref:YopX family protein n=1 Tax=Macrococcoides canis TaxID=1855823 RepID=UPI0020B67DF1|nr:YopX family protein [Macrococcus canis]UTH01647.1 hypothetical protein KFV05_07935 [Macrococcus canis]